MVNMIALYAAIVATVVLVWDIYKWKTSGPEISLTASPNIKVLGDPELEGKTYISIEARNIGSRPTTILKLGFLYYKNWWHRVRGKHEVFLWVVHPHTQHGIPYVLQQGTVWNGLAHQNKDIEKKAKEGLLFCALFLSHTEKPRTVRVVLRPDEG